MLVARVPENPGYRWGNFLLLPECPRPDELDGLTHQARHLFRDQPASRHVTIRWDGEAFPAELREQAEVRGFQANMGRSMCASELRRSAASGLEIRPLDLQVDGAEIESLNRLCDPQEQEGEPDYVDFKQRLRASWKVWATRGEAIWWGAFAEGRLVGQLGFVLCPSDRGRFQSVETHPDLRRQGVCTALVTAVGCDAFEERGVRELLLGIEPESAAFSVYRKLGFSLGGWQRGLVLPDAEI